MVLLTSKKDLMKDLSGKISKNNMMNTIEFLSKEDNARVAGCEGEKKASLYLKEQLEDLELNAEIHEFELDRPVSIGIGTLNINEEMLKIKSFNGGCPIPKDLNNELVYIGFATKEDIDNHKDLKGKIALIKRGKNSFAHKVSLAYEGGAACIIIFNNSEGIGTGSVGKIVPPIPILGMSLESGEKLLKIIEENSKAFLTFDNFNIDIEYHNKSTSHNVLGELQLQNKTADTKTIVLGAHLDCASSPGASDNATGVSVMLEVARLLCTTEVQNKLTHNILFVAFGSEEIGLLGSKALVEKFKSENILSNIDYMINLDMVGVGTEINVFNLDNILSKEISDLAVKHIKAGQGVFGGAYTNMNSSDHASFEYEDIPASLIQTAPDNYFHTENDTIEKIDPDNLYNVAKVVLSIILESNNII